MSLSLRIRSFFAASAIFALTPLMPAQAGSHSPASRLVRPIVESEVVTLAGNVYPLARPEFDRGILPPETRLDRVILLLAPTPAQKKALEELLEAQQNPTSAEFHHWLSPQQYGVRFGASTQDLAKISAWLQSHGFTVEPAAAGRRQLVFSGTAAQIEDAFHTQMHRYVINGAEHIANSQDPQIPQALAPVVSGILSLHDFRRTSAIRAEKPVSFATPEYSQGTTHYLVPADFATIYDVNPLYTAGETGTGTSIAIVGRSDINLSDVSSFRSFAALPAKQPKVILTGSDPGLVSGDQDESTLDVEWSGAVAPAATVNFVVSASTQTTDGVDLSAQYIVNNRISPVMSTSYGSCEANMGSGELAFYNSLWQQAASEGISSFVSAGDSGAAGCNSGSSSTGSGTGVNGLCSSPWSTCVGGTEFNEGSSNYWASSNGAGSGSALSYIPEMVWNESGSNGGSGLWSSGGGISIAYPQPAWQAGVSGASSNGMRAVPDVALTSAGHDGYIVCLDGSYYIFSGTSASSPSFAGLMSLIVQKQGGTGQGDANPTLYGLLNASANPFHSTPSGNNSVPGVTGFTASGAPYNLATGLGSVDANVLTSVWAGSGTPPPTQSFTVTPSFTSESLLPGKSTTFTVAVAGANGFNTAVNLSAHVPAGVTLTFSPVSVMPGAHSIATLTVAGSAAPGSSTIGITGAGTGTHASLTASASVALTVQAPPTLSVSSAASHVTVQQGRTAAYPFTVTTGSSYAGTVSLAITGLPSGVTGTWAPASFTSTGATTTTATLTLRATAGAASSPSAGVAMRVTASGDGLQSSFAGYVQVTAGPSTTVTLSPAQVSMKSTASQAVIATITPIGGIAPSSGLAGVSFVITGLPTGITGSWSAPIRTASGAIQATLTLTGSGAAITTTTAPTVTTRMTDASSGVVYTAAQQMSLAVTRANVLRVSAAAVRVSLEAGKNVTDLLTIATGNSFHDPVTFAISGLPAGVTAAWSINPVRPNSRTGQGRATLKLSATANSNAATVKVTIHARGGGVSATETLTIEVQHRNR